MTSDPEYRTELERELRALHYLRVGEIIQDRHDHSDEHTHLPELIEEMLDIAHNVHDERNPDARR